MEQLENGRWAVIEWNFTADQVASMKIHSTEDERQFAQERFKIVTYQEGMCDR